MIRGGRILGLIPARGGSQGIPRKNIKALGGEPLIAYTIKAALASKKLHTVCVSTDDRVIAESASRLGASVPFMRPAHLATSRASAVDVVHHALEYYCSQGEEFDGVCLLQPTCPFRPSDQIDRAVSRWQDEGGDSLVSVLPVPPTCNPYWVMFEREGRLIPVLQREEVVTRRQDLPPVYQRSGSIYLVSCQTFLRTKSFFSGEVIPFLHCEKHHVNLDTPDDWLRAEELLSKRDEMALCCRGIS